MVEWQGHVLRVDAYDENVEYLKNSETGKEEEVDEYQDDDVKMTNLYYT